MDEKIRGLESTAHGFVKDIRTLFGEGGIHMDSVVEYFAGVGFETVSDEEGHVEMVGQGIGLKVVVSERPHYGDELTYARLQFSSTNNVPYLGDFRLGPCGDLVGSDAG